MYQCLDMSSLYLLKQKRGNEPTTKKRAMAKVPSIAVHTFYAVRPSVVHGKGAFAVRLFLRRA
jgi:hypothetical protein